MRKPCSDPPHHYILDAQDNGACIKCGAAHPKGKGWATMWLHPDVVRPGIRPRTNFEDNGTPLVFGYAKTPPGWG